MKEIPQVQASSDKPNLLGDKKYSRYQMSTYLAVYGNGMLKTRVIKKSLTYPKIRAFCIQRTGGPAHPSAPADLS